MESIISRTLQYARIPEALKKEEGQTFAEYALIFALVVVVGMVALPLLGTNIAARFTEVATQIGA